MLAGQKSLKIFTGPNLITPKPLIAIVYDNSFFSGDISLTHAEIEKLSLIIPKPLQDYIYPDQFYSDAEEYDANEFMVDLVKALLNIKLNQSLLVEYNVVEEGVYQLIAEFEIEGQVSCATHLAFQIVSFIKSKSQRPDHRQIQFISYLFQNLTVSLPGSVIGDTLKVAKKWQIPFYPVGNGPMVLSYGQGIKAVVYDYASNDRDSLFGYVIQKNKRKTNAYLKRLGYPTTDQALCSSMEACQQAVRHMGFPVVVKPISEGQGNGVTANICSAQQLAKAYQVAAKYSKEGVLVEKFIEGDVYRITVSQHQLNTVYNMVPARVVGDGKTSVSGLIEKENVNRANERAKGNKFKDLELDEVAMLELTNAKIMPQSIPKAGEKVYLRRVSNTASGGAYEKVEYEEIHPDVLQLATDVTRAFRLDSAGIDYVSKDISKSWRDDGGAIIEVNAFPSIEELLAEGIFKNHFSDDIDCRIPTQLIVTESDDFAVKSFEEVKSRSTHVGFVSSNSTYFKGGEMAISDENISFRCASLLLNPTCEGLVVLMRPDEITEHGLPIDYFDQCIIDPDTDTATADKEIIEKTGKVNLSTWLSEFVGELQV